MAEIFLSRLQTAAVYEFEVLNCSLEALRERKKKPRHLNAFQFVKFPIFPKKGEKGQNPL
jgi:hypothetical protein